MDLVIVNETKQIGPKSEVVHKTISTRLIFAYIPLKILCTL